MSTQWVESSVSKTLALGDAEVGDKLEPFSSDFEVVGIHLNSVSKTILIILALLSAIFILRVVFSKTPLTRIMPDSSFLVVVGVVLGIILYFSGGDLGFIKFDYNFFILLLIPPIIFDSGYFLQKDFFFKNIVEILIFAVFGTLFNCLIVSGILYAFTGNYKVRLSFPQILTFEALASAVDPVAVIAIFDDVHVNETLYTITFGESVLNDAVCIVLYNVFSSLEAIIQDQGDGPAVQAKMAYLAIAKFLYVFVGGVVVGAVITLILTILAKFVGRVHYIELFIPYIIAILAYVVADVLLMSGIMSVLISGIMLARYNEPNMHLRIRTAFRVSLKSLASISESVIFVLLGLSAAESFGKASQLNAIDGIFIVLTILGNIASRFILTFGFTALLNLGRRKKGLRIPFRDQFILAFGGLRGAIAFALSYSLPTENGFFPENVKSELVSSIMIFIFITIFVFGIAIKPLLKLMNVKRAKAEGEGNPIFVTHEDIVASHLRKKKKKEGSTPMTTTAATEEGSLGVLETREEEGKEESDGTIDMIHSNTSEDSEKTTTDSEQTSNTNTNTNASSSQHQHQKEEEEGEEEGQEETAEEKDAKRRKKRGVSSVTDSVADPVAMNLIQLGEMTLQEVLSCAVAGFRAVAHNTRQRSRLQRVVNAIDLFIQKMCLRELLPEQKELLAKLDEIQDHMAREKAALNRKQQLHQLQLPVVNPDGTISQVTTSDIRDASTKTMVLLQQKVDLIKRLKNFGIAEGQISVYQTLQSTKRRGRVVVHARGGDVDSSEAEDGHNGESYTTMPSIPASTTNSTTTTTLSSSPSTSAATGRTASVTRGSMVSRGSIVAQYSDQVKNIGIMGRKSELTVSHDEIKAARLLFKDSTHSMMSHSKKSHLLEGTEASVAKAIATIHNISTLHRRMSNVRREVSSSSSSSDTSVSAKRNKDRHSLQSSIDSESPNHSTKGKLNRRHLQNSLKNKLSANTEDIPELSEGCDVDISVVGTTPLRRDSGENTRRRIVMNRRNPYTIIDISSNDEEDAAQVSAPTPARIFTMMRKAQKHKGPQQDSVMPKAPPQRQQPQEKTTNTKERKRDHRDKEGAGDKDGKGRQLPESMLFNFGFNNKQNMKKINKIDKELGEQYPRRPSVMRKEAEPQMAAGESTETSTESEE